MITEPGTDTHFAPNWRHVGIFLALSFGLTWLLDLAIYLRGGLGSTGIVAALRGTEPPHLIDGKILAVTY